MSQIIEISKKRVFTLEEAQDLLSLVLRMTETADIRVKALLQRLETLNNRDPERAKDLEEEVDLIIRQWQQKIEKLGAVAKGLWLVDFDNGKGYFCWKYPERKVMFSHGYHDGYSGRKAIFENEELLN